MEPHLPDWPAFIRANTRVLAPPLVPEVRLHLADESVAIWRRTEEELAAGNLPPPFWAFAWAGGQALARYLLDTPELVAGRRVLDIGSGSGLSAIAAKLAGASHVLAAEVDPVACEAIRLNRALNDCDVEIKGSDMLSAPFPEGYDVLLIGDVFYERQLADRMISFAEQARIAGTAILAGDPKRSYFPSERFEQLAAYAVPVSRDLEDYEIRNASVWRLTS